MCWPVCGTGLWRVLCKAIVQWWSCKSSGLGQLAEKTAQHCVQFLKMYTVTIVMHTENPFQKLPIGLEL